MTKNMNSQLVNIQIEETQKYIKETQLMRMAEVCGMTFSGYNDDNEPEFIGTSKQWKDFDEMRFGNN